ncbi:hypothetical protein [Paenibacillus terrae]|uniref:Uncharacterized protein n=1 Tax=Paenibacillus terrae TaxID=159743 RepID=A0A0D7X5R5_9BACL|nr:hypothetical protein [Paenibacillus terrae]KJD46343.1 hypothetical protein QD47_07215 [Paenibacillus terrae]
MEKITQMNKQLFRENLLKTVDEVKKQKGLINQEIRFIVEPVEEHGKNLNSTDEWIKLTLLSKENTNGRYLELDEIIKLFTGLIPLVPIWLNISFEEVKDYVAIFKIQTSLRFRKPSILQNQETGHPPFKALL